MAAPAFVPGLELAEALWKEGVAPVLATEFPDLAHAAALIGPGSEVLGFDDATSTDHHWGPRLLLFLRDEDHAAHAAAIERALRERLPPRVRGWSTSFAPPGPDGSRLLEEPEPGNIHHRVEIWPLDGFFRAALAWDPQAEIEVADWLTFPQQVLLSLTSGRVFRDDVGLESIRARLAWYPRDVWLYLLASCWRRISQDEHLVARAALVGDELGSRVIAARLARDLARLCFLLERRHAPYAKWLGTAFRRLACGPELAPLLERIVAANDWPARERALCDAYRRAAALQNASGLAEPLAEEPTPFYDRPFRVIFANRFSDALCARIVDPEVAELAKLAPIGSLDTWSDSTDLTNPRWRRRLTALYAARRPV
jgi:hypothetical protein